MTRVLVTGANGFVGRCVCQRLLDAGYLVRGTYRRDGTSLPEGVEPARIGDVEEFDGWSPLLSGVQGVVHLIARTHVTSDRGYDALETYRGVNVTGTQRLLSACESAGVRRFVFLSSIKAVGEGQAAAYRETDPCHPQDAYGISKREAEQIVQTACQGLEHVILRSPLVYGPGVGGNFLRIARAVRAGVPLPLASVSNARSMVCVENLADAVQACLVHPSAAGNMFHVADHEPLSTRQLVELLAAAMKQRPRLVPAPLWLLRTCGHLTGRGAEVHRLVDSLTLATDHICDTLSWQPPVSSQEGIRRTVAAMIANSRNSRNPNARRAA